MKQSSNQISLKDFVNTNINSYQNSNITIKLVNAETNERFFIGSKDKSTTTYYTVIYDPQHILFPIGNSYYCWNMKDVIDVVDYIFAHEDIYATKQTYLNSQDILDQEDTISLDDKKYDYLYKDLADPDSIDY